jgi:hypothetical protein
MHLALEVISIFPGDKNLSISDFALKLFEKTQTPVEIHSSHFLPMIVTSLACAFDLVSLVPALKFRGNFMIHVFGETLKETFDVAQQIFSVFSEIEVVTIHTDFHELEIHHNNTWTQIEQHLRSI